MAPMVTVRGQPHHRGIDVSVWQGGSIDWPTVARCADWAGIKVGGGDGGIYVDRCHAVNMGRSRDWLPRGGYWFLGWGNARAQARACLQATNAYQGYELPLTLDIETYGPSGQYRPTSADVADFIDEFTKGTTRRWTGPTGLPVAVIVYTGAPLAGVVGQLPWLVHHDLWLAAYLNGAYPNPAGGVTNGCPPNVAALGLPNRYVPPPWQQRGWSAWQFAGGDGGIVGVGNGRANCDQNVMTTECFTRLLGGTPSRPQTLEDTLSAEEVKAIQDHITAEANRVIETVAGYHDDTRTWTRTYLGLTVDDVAHGHTIAARITDAGWASRPYAAQVAGQPEVWVVDPVAMTKRHVTSTVAADGSTSPTLLRLLGKLGLNPDIVVVNDPAEVAELAALPVAAPGA